MEKDKLISIVIPVYNAQENISRCLESILFQTYRNLEILLVNDASTDKSLEIIYHFKEQAEKSGMKVTVLHHPNNCGVALARNTALDAATGDYIYSMDSDDYIDPECIKEMVLATEKYGADIVGIDWNLTYATNERRIRQANVSSGKELFEKMTSGILRWNLWLWMIRRTLIEEHGFRFIPGANMGEDMMFMIKLSLYAKTVCMINKPFYHYVQTNNSALTKKWSESAVIQVSENMAEIERYFNTCFGGTYVEDLMRLKLNIKLPLLISDKKEDYEMWKCWFPEANTYTNKLKNLPFRTTVIQKAASKGQWWLVWLYYKLVIKFVYGVLYK